MKITIDRERMEDVLRAYTSKSRGEAGLILKAFEIFIIDYLIEQETRQLHELDKQADNYTQNDWDKENAIYGKELI